MHSMRGRLPSFIIIGAAKSGTSTLFDYLARHPHIYAAEEKEPCFFDADVAWNRGQEWYESLFAKAQPHQKCGEASTNYTRYPQVPGVPERMRATLPNVRLIYIVRDPVERAYSHYVHRYSKELFPGQPFRVSFEEHVENDPMCIDSSLFDRQIDRYLQVFPREQLLVLSFDELRRDPKTLLTRVQAFLEVPEQDLLGQEELHSNRRDVFLDHTARRRALAPLKRIPGSQALARALGTEWKDRAVEALMKTPWGSRIQQSFEPPPMSPSTQRALRDRFAPTIDRLELIMGQDLSAWRKAG